jgi:uncharacterized protein
MTATIDAPAANAPVTGTERVDLLDVMRGIAVLGILLVNVDSFIGYGFDLPGEATALGARFNDPAEFLVEFLVQGKFYCLFSFLFGVGFSVFIQRAGARGHDAVPLFKRRLVGLLLIGLVHTCLIWYGDILTNYAVIGFGLIPFLRRDDRAVLRAAVIWLASPVAFYLVFLAIAYVVAGPPSPASGGGLPPILADAVNAFAHGRYPDVVKGNAVFTLANVVRRLVLMFFPRVFGMFLLGFWAGRANLFGQLDRYAPLLRRVCALGFSIGLPLALIGAALGDSGSPRPPSLTGLADMTAETIATPALALAYGAAICLLYRSAPAAMRVMAPVGRMALTSYLTHSVVGVVAFYGIGFGFYGGVSLPVALAGCFAFFALQIAASRLWLSVAAFGPAEWLWRMFTYRRRFALFR